MKYRSPTQVHRCFYISPWSVLRARSTPKSMTLQRPDKESARRKFLAMRRVRMDACISLLQQRWSWELCGQTVTGCSPAFDAFAISVTRRDRPLAAVSHIRHYATCNCPVGSGCCGSSCCLAPMLSAVLVREKVLLCGRSRHVVAMRQGRKPYYV